MSGTKVSIILYSGLLTWMLIFKSFWNECAHTYVAAHFMQGYRPLLLQRQMNHCSLQFLFDRTTVHRLRLVW